MAGIDTPVTRDELLQPLKLRDTDRLVVTLHGDDANQYFLQIGSTDGFPSHAAHVDFPSRFPERKQSGARVGIQWVVPATDISVQLIHNLWPKDQVKLEPDAEIVFNYFLATVQHQQIAMRRSARYREYVPMRTAVKDFTVPTEKFVDSFDLANDHQPMLHQNVALANCMNSDGYGLFMEQGTGKTLVVIGRVDKEAPIVKVAKKRMHRTLIVAPKNVRYNWTREFAEFSRVPGKTTVLRGGQFKRMKQLFEAMIPDPDVNETYTVVIVSYEGLTNTWDVLSKIEWDLAVLDEAHFIKGSQTKRSKSALQLRDVARSRMALTGTPVCNSVLDLYTLFEFMREGGSGFKTYEAFRRFYGVFKAVDPDRGTKRLVDVQNLPFMRERLARMSFIVRKEEALPDLPDKVYDIVEVEMTDTQREIYDKVSEQLYAEIENDLNDETKQINADNILTKLLRLAQITSGFVSFDPIVDLDSGEEIVPRTIDRFDPNPKVEELVEILKEKTPDQKTIVWAHFMPDISTIMARLKLENIDAVEFRGRTKEAEREDAVRRFNEDPACKVFVGNPGAGGTGLNLLGYPPGRGEEYTTNCDHVIYYSQDWSHPKRSQSEDRAHRRGTRSNVRISDLTILGTIDEEIRARVTNKRYSALQVQDLRAVLGRVLGKKL